MTSVVESYALLAPTLHAAQICPLAKVMSASAHPGYPSETESEATLTEVSSTSAPVEDGLLMRPSTVDEEFGGKPPTTATAQVEGEVAETWNAEYVLEEVPDWRSAAPMETAPGT